MMDREPTSERGRDDAAGLPDPVVRARVDAALNRVLCELALGDPAHAGAIEPLCSLVRGLAVPVLDDAVAGVERAQSGAALAEALQALSDVWTRWTVSADGGLCGAAQGGEPGAGVVTGLPAASALITADVMALGADPELASMFAAEALDHLSTIEAAVLQLEAAPGDTQLLDDIFRPFHTVKGNAGALGVVTVQELAHTVENLLDLCRSGRHRLGPAEADAVLDAVDLLSAQVRDLQARLAGGAGTDLEPRRQALMRVFEALAGEAHDGVDEAARQAPGVAEAPEAPDLFPPGSGERTIAEVPSQGFSRRADDTGAASVKVDTRKLDNLVDMVGELVIAQSILQEDPALSGATDEQLSRKLAHLRRMTSDLQRTAMSMRMVPIRQTFQKMARLVRDLSKRSGKTIDLVLSGEDTELDRRVVEDINDPLMHMVRNSIDHGIEDAGRRAAAGKRAQGRLALSAYHQGGNIVIAIEDDGAGLNTERILAKAIERGLVRAGEVLAPADIHQLIFQPGFSTADTVTEISGRGVGMDVVGRNIAALRGRIEIQSVPGQGTTFLIKLPLTLAILDGLVLGVGAERFVMPTFAVRESLRPLPEQVHTVMDKPAMIQVRGRLVPVVRLATICRIEPREHDLTRCTVVVIEDDGHCLGLAVDQLLGKQEVVIKSLGDALGQMPGVAGGAILGDGRVGLILDAHGIVRLSRSDAARAA